MVKQAKANSGGSLRDERLARGAGRARLWSAGEYNANTGGRSLDNTLILRGQWYDCTNLLGSTSFQGMRKNIAREILRQESIRCFGVPGSRFCAVPTISLAD
jgi:hypothetical protein